MASLYLRGQTYWLTYKDDSGKWRSKSTGYRANNFGEKKQAELLCRKATKEEQAARDVSVAGDQFEDWVPRWLKERYDGRKGTTYDRYSRSWRVLERYFQSLGVKTPAQVTFNVVDGYLSWRLQNNGKKNTAIGELKLLAMILDHAIRKGFLQANVARRLGLKRERAAEKIPWPDNAVVTVAKDLAEKRFSSWMHVSLGFGLYQAARLRQIEGLPLSAIDLERGVIHYPFSFVKGEKSFSQPIDPRFRPLLARIVDALRKQDQTTLPRLPQFPSIEWRTYLDGLGYEDLSHHGLRVRWITEAAKAEVPLAKAKKFVNHSSDLVHEIYQKLTVTDVSDVPLRIPMPSL
jgi:hypothetical protein